MPLVDDFSFLFLKDKKMNPPSSRHNSCARTPSDLSYTTSLIDNRDFMDEFAVDESFDSGLLSCNIHENLSASAHADIIETERLGSNLDLRIPECEEFELSDLRNDQACSNAREILNLLQISHTVCHDKRVNDDEIDLPDKSNLDAHMAWKCYTQNPNLKHEASFSISCEETAKAYQEKNSGFKRRLIRRKSSERVPFEGVPDFIVDEMNSTSGVGHFTLPELMCCLLFAYSEGLEPNCYASIKAKMGNRRSRVSIRRKIEKVVTSEIGFSSGLLGLEEDQHKLVMEAIWNRLMSLVRNAETHGSPKLKVFANKMRWYAQTVFYK